MNEEDRAVAESIGIALRRFVWYPGDIRVIRGRDRVGAEDMTPWVGEEAQPEEHVDLLDMAQCWREGCYHWVPLEDDLGLCPQCVAYLRDL